MWGARMRDALERLRAQFSNARNGEVIVFWVLATCEVVQVVATYLLPPLGVAALVKYLFL